MISYKDRTFCAAVCAVNDCPSKYTQEVYDAAQKWWGKEGAPIALTDYSATCEMYVPTIEEESKDD